jgi:phage tail-like protein
MALSPLHVGLGTSSGRISPTEWVAPDDEFILVLGREKAGFYGAVVADDSVAWSQTFAAEAQPNVLRMQLRLRSSTLPAGLEWRFVGSVDGTPFVTLPLDRNRELGDVAANLGQIGSGSTALELKLILVDTGYGAIWYEAEIPGVFVDALVETAPAQDFVLANRNPEPSEKNVPISSTIALEVFSMTGATVDIANTKILVNGELAWGNGSFTAGFDGSDSTNSFINGGTDLRVVIDPTTDFTSEQVVTVEVITTGLESSYSFTAEDIAAPQVTSAFAAETRRVRITFDEAVKQTDPEAANDALNPENYILIAKSAPAVEPTPIAVTAFSAFAIELELDIDLTPECLYEVTVYNVVDTSGNEIAAPNNTASFLGFKLPHPPGRKFDLWWMLPRLARDQDQTGDLWKFIACLQELLNHVLYSIDRWTEIFDPDVAPEWAVDLMLEGLGNPFPFALSLLDKRRLLRVLVTMYRLKGTAVGIKNVVRFFMGIEIEITSYMGESLILGESLLGEDWILGPSGAWARYAFEIISPIILTDEQRSRIRQIAEYMKPAHTHLARIVEPETPYEPDHLELGESELGTQWDLH